MARRNTSGIHLKANRTSADLGGLAAEKDLQLAKYYVRKDRYVDRALNLDDQASFFVGSKGAGKSAILQMVRLSLQTEAHRIISLSPTQLAFSALANIDIASPMLKEPNKKQWLYKSLWDYIFATEVGGREFAEEGVILKLLKSVVRTKDEKQVRRLLTMRYDDQGRPESLSSRFLKLIKEVEISGEAEIEGIKLEGKAKAEPADWERGKQGQFKLLGMIHEASSRIADTITSRYYILIDDLDVDWHNESTQNEILAAMFASLRKLCRPPHLKCIVSNQDRIFRELPIEHKDKFRDSLCNVEWEADVVKEMIEKRIKHVVDIPPGKIWDGLFRPADFEYLWARTSGKPREAIRFASLCIETARRASHKSVEPGDIKKAAKQFSAERLEDIGSELEYLYPAFTTFLRQFSGFHKEFPVSRVKDAVDKCILQSLDDKKKSNSWIMGYEQDFYPLVKVLLENQILLFKHTRKDEPQGYNPEEHDILNDGAYLAFHPMYVAGLGLIGDI